MNCLTCIYSVVLFDLHLFWFTVWSVFILLYCLAWIYSDVLSDLYLFWCTGTVWPVFILMYCLTCIYSDVCTVWPAFILMYCDLYYSDVLYDLYFILMYCLTCILFWWTVWPVFILMSCLTCMDSDVSSELVAPGEAPIALVHRTCIGALVHWGLARPSHKQFAKLFS